MNEELNINEIVRVETLPVIFQQLEKVGEYIESELANIDNIDVSEENKQEAKKVRTNINNTLKKFEDKRKEIKEQCLDAYNQFNEKYEEEVKSKLQNASLELGEKITQIEKEQLFLKEKEIYSFINEHIKANHLQEIIDVDKVEKGANLKINLSNSVKSLKDSALAFIERVSKDIELINMENEYKDEILYEYKNNFLDYVLSKSFVLNRHKQMEELSSKEEVQEQKIEEDNKVAEYVEEITMPKEIINEEELLQVTFTLKGTKQQIKQVKELIIELGMEYE